MSKAKSTEQDVELLKNTTVEELAMQLENGLLHAGTLPDDVSVLEFIKHYMHR